MGLQAVVVTFATCVALAGGMVTTGSGPHRAIAKHNYSVASENSARHYTGLSTKRRDVAVTQPRTGCNHPFRGDPIYQTQWIRSFSGQDFIEFGTGHQCSNNFVYHYYVYGQNGIFHVIGHRRNGPHTKMTRYRITRSGSPNTWYFPVKSRYVASLSWRRSFPEVQTGLESYAPYGHVRPYWHTYLRVQRFGHSRWRGWRGRDARSVDNPPMCGSWGHAAWRTGEASSC